MIEPIVANIPYPNIEDVKKDYKSAKIIWRAYGGLHGEFNLGLQYTRKLLANYPSVSKESMQVLLGIALAEFKHLTLLYDLLEKLGAPQQATMLKSVRREWVKPPAQYGKNKEKKILLDVLALELVSIEEHKKTLAMLFNERAKSVIARIIKDEEMHVQRIESLLAKYNEQEYDLLKI